MITADGYTVSDTLGEEYKDSYTISAQEGTVAKTLYFKDEAGHMSDGVEVTVKFDLTPPTGEIAVGANGGRTSCISSALGIMRQRNTP